MGNALNAYSATIFAATEDFPCQVSLISLFLRFKPQGKKGDHPWSQTEASGINHIFSNCIFLKEEKIYYLLLNMSFFLLCPVFILLVRVFGMNTQLKPVFIIIHKHVTCTGARI